MVLSSPPDSSLRQPRHPAQPFQVPATGLRADGNTDAFNRILWQGNMGDNVSCPTTRSGLGLRQNRALLLKLWQENKMQSHQNAAPSPYSIFQIRVVLVTEAVILSAAKNLKDAYIF
jgi:hypothetical protein